MKFTPEVFASFTVPVSAMAEPPLIVRVPALMVVVPVYVLVPLRVSVPAPVLVMPPLFVASKSVMFELIVVIAPELTTLIFPEVKSLKASGPVPFANVTFPVVALFARVHAVALAVTEVLPLPAPNVMDAADNEPFVMDVVFVELKPCSKLIEFA